MIGLKNKLLYLRDRRKIVWVAIKIDVHWSTLGNTTDYHTCFSFSCIYTDTFSLCVFSTFLFGITFIQMRVIGRNFIIATK